MPCSSCSCAIGAVLAHHDLEQIWGYHFDSFTNVIGVVNYLRRSSTRTGRPRLIHTVRGVGYVLRREEAEK